MENENENELDAKIYYATRSSKLLVLSLTNEIRVLQFDFEFDSK